jgi:hypothetical protein
LLLQFHRFTTPLALQTTLATVYTMELSTTLMEVYSFAISSQQLRFSP